METNLSSKEEILSVELSNEDERLNTSKVINSVSDFPNKIYAVMEIQGKPVSMQIDSSAPRNVLPKKYLPGAAEVQKTNKLLRAYNKQQISACIMLGQERSIMSSLL